MSVGFSLLCTVFGIPFALTCVRSYYKDHAVLKDVSDSEVSSMRQEFLNITGRSGEEDNTLPSSLSKGSIATWIEENHGKELRQHLATAQLKIKE